jgi:hypothetical protein
MYNVRDVHLKIKELSSRNRDGRPHIHVNELAKDLHVSLGELKPLLDTLYATAFIDHYKGCTDIVSLTETGKNSEIPLHGSWEREPGK